jgi:hypothetical protein
MPAVPVGLIAERRLITRLMHADAMTAANAQSLHGLPWFQERRLKRLLAKGVIRETSPGNYYLSAPELASHLTARRHRAAVAIAIVLILFALTTYFSAR